MFVLLTGVGNKGGMGARPPPHKKKSGEIFSANYHAKFGHFSGKYHVKFANLVNFSGKCRKNSGILIIFQANIT